MMRYALAACLAVSLLSPCSRADAALNAYMRLTGETQGEIRGDVTQAGREDSIEVWGFHHEIQSPVDVATGLPTGKRQHKPITVIKPIDRATPLLFNALTTNENITDWRIDFWRPDRTGREVQYYTIELVNASVVGIRTEMLDNQFPENQRIPVREHVSFVYQKIIWTYQDGGITAEDDWETRVGANLPQAARNADRIARADASARLSPWARNALRKREQRGVSMPAARYGARRRVYEIPGLARNDRVLRPAELESLRAALSGPRTSTERRPATRRELRRERNL